MFNIHSRWTIRLTLLRSPVACIFHGFLFVAAPPRMLTWLPERRPGAFHAFANALCEVIPACAAFFKDMIYLFKMQTFCFRVKEVYHWDEGEIEDCPH